MQKIEWSVSTYGVGIKEIDEQHQHLFDLTNRLIGAFEAEENLTCAKKIIPELIRYAEYHFSTEEDYMLKANYGNLAEHKKEHVKFIEELAIQVDLILSLEKPVSLHLLTFLCDWITDHVRQVDKKMAEIISAP